MRLGLMGGTFDPVHVGHLRAAENARETLGLDRVAFMPARVPPHRAQPQAEALHRFAMTALAVSSHPAFVVSDLELSREGPSYTVDTVRALLEEEPAREVVLIVGTDNLPLLPEWREVTALLALCTVAVVGRPGAAESAPAVPGGRFVSVPDSGIALSSTALRERVKAGRSIRYLVPEPVAQYIQNQGLYR